MQTLHNGVQVFTNGDDYNLAEDVAHAFETANVITTIHSHDQREGLAALAPGGVLPVPTFIYRTDLNRRETWNGVEWLGDVRHAEIDYPKQTGVPHDQPWGPGTGAIQDPRSLYSGFATMPGNDLIQVSHAGIYAISWYTVISGFSGAPMFFAVNRGDTRIYGEQKASGFEFTTNVPNIHMNAGERFKLIMVQTSGALRDMTHRVRVTRVG